MHRHLIKAKRLTRSLRASNLMASQEAMDMEAAKVRKKDIRTTKIITIRIRIRSTKKISSYLSPIRINNSTTRRIKDYWVALERVTMQ